jgi:hypothetical protein
MEMKKLKYATKNRKFSVLKFENKLAISPEGYEKN